MVSNELRIGNCILKNGSNYIVDTLFFVDVYDGTAMGFDLQPIPLTKEILLKCGGKYKSIRHREECFINGQCFEFYINNNEISLVYTGGEGVDMSLPIKYLHDLQNIMPFLTNEELTVNL